jgi:hypothetical protein
MLLCCKIYTNHTHIVAQCFESTGSIHYSNIEMQLSKKCRLPQTGW